MNDLAQATLDALSAHIAVLDKTGTIIAVNRSWRAFAKANPPLASNVNEGVNYLAVCDTARGPDSEMAAMAAAGIRAVIHGTESVFEMEYPCHSPDTKRWFFLRVNRVPCLGDACATVEHMDITKRKQLEEDLAHQRDIYELILEHSLAGYWDWDIPTGDEYLSSTFKKMFGYEDHEMENRAESWQKVIFAEDLPFVIDNFNQHVESKGSEPYYNEVRYLHKNGSTVWVICTGRVIEWDDDGKARRMIGCHIDITERKEREAESLAQQQFQAMLADIAADFNSMNADNVDETITTALQRIGECFAADRGDVFLFSADHSTVSNTHEWHRGGVARCAVLQNYPVDQAPWYKSQILDHGTIVCIPDVEQMPLEAAVEQALLRDHGVGAAVSVPLLSGVRILGFIGLELEHPYAWKDSELHNLSFIAQIMADSLARIESTKKLVELKRVAEAANTAKSGFLSSMSHELRTPLNAILGFAQLLQNDDVLSAQHRAFVEEVVTAGNHLLSLVNEVLDLAMIDSGRVELSIESVSCGAVLRESVSLVEPLARQKAVRLETGEPAELYVFADRVRLKQVLVNLLSNGVKYNRTHGVVTIAVSVHGEVVRISVKDTGEGIPGDKIGDVFTQFNRLGREGGTVEGTGIGLALSKRLVVLMNGNVGVESVPGEGSTFWVELPAGEKESTASLDSALADHEDGTSGTGRDEEPVTILYIEDNPGSIRLMEQILAKRGHYRLITARNGSDGLDLAEQERPEIMLLDINLPGMDGYEILKRIRASKWGRQTPVIAVSANAMKGAVQRGEAAGFVTYVTKPFDIPRFLETLEKVTVEHRIRDTGSR